MNPLCVQGIRRRTCRKVLRRQHNTLGAHLAIIYTANKTEDTTLFLKKYIFTHVNTPHETHETHQITLTSTVFPATCLARSFASADTAWT